MHHIKGSCYQQCLSLLLLNLIAWLEVVLVTFLHCTVTLLSLSILYSLEGSRSLCIIAHTMRKGNCAPPPGRSCISNLVLNNQRLDSNTCWWTKVACTGRRWGQNWNEREWKSLQNAQEWSFSLVSYGPGRSSEKEGALEESGDLNFFINSSCTSGLERGLM